jgi:nicotinamide phosphoribosyltransferase
VLGGTHQWQVDPGKVSKKGRLDLVRDATTKEYVTYPMGEAPSSQPSELVEVFRNGELIRDWTFDEVRGRSELA